MTFPDRELYARLYGPTTGDRVRLGDTCLWVQVEADDTSYGDELLGGCGKTLRDGLLVAPRSVRDSALDMVISSVIAMDPLIGVRKTNIGIKDGRIVGIGRTGNPAVMDDVAMVIDSHTAIIPGEGLIATPGIVDSHVHLSSPAIVPAALASGITTVVGMGLGGVWDVGSNPAWNLHTMIESWRDIPMNLALLGRGSSSSTELLEESIHSGISGFKIHEDFGATPTIVDTCLSVAEDADVAVALHTDSLNESGSLADTVAATRGRTVHAYHVEGGGGHPDLLEILVEPNILASSTTPTLPLTVNTVAELYPMTMTVHRQSALIESDVNVSRSRIREHGIAAENLLHDTGAISIINSDSMGMGRIGELPRRTWQLAHVRAELAGHGGPDHSANQRVLQYLAKITINPAIAHGFSHEVGSLQSGRLADIVLWHPASFGAKPELVVKGGFVAWGVSGSGSGSTRLCQPRILGPFFGGIGHAPRRTSSVFVAQSALNDPRSRNALPKEVNYAVVQATRHLQRSDMVRNSKISRVQMAARGDPVVVDGREVAVQSATDLPLTRAHHLA